MVESINYGEARAGAFFGTEVMLLETVILV
jgi:hypothetical protein